MASFLWCHLGKGKLKLVVYREGKDISCYKNYDDVCLTCWLSFRNHGEWDRCQKTDGQCSQNSKGEKEWLS